MIGPKITVKKSCFDCDVCVSEKYRCQSDSGYDLYCAHPEFKERKRFGDSDWSTPEWCPELNAKSNFCRINATKK